MSRITPGSTYEGLANPEPIQNKIDEGKPLSPDEEAVRKSVADFNAIRMNAVSIARDDLWFSIIRVVVVAVMSVATLGAVIALIVAIAISHNVAAIVTSGSVVLVSLIFAGLVNPLQTVERDEVFRRWSDTIVSNYVVRIADPDAHQAEVRDAGHDATSQFAVLAASYSALVAKNAQSMSSQTAPKAAATGTSQTDPGKAQNPT